MLHLQYICIVNSAAYIRAKGLKATPIRTSVLDAIQQSDTALTTHELETQLGKIDRITLYRVLKDFCETGLLHKITGADGAARFAICHNECSQEAHSDDHVHFTCSRCQRMYCLAHTHAPSIKLPPGFNMNTVQILVEGTCNQCTA
jgi:Fur family ferric uptake transcriptional regulator